MIASLTYSLLTRLKMGQRRETTILWFYKIMELTGVNIFKKIVCTILQFYWFSKASLDRALDIVKVIFIFLFLPKAFCEAIWFQSLFNRRILFSVFGHCESEMLPLSDTSTEGSWILFMCHLPVGCYCILYHGGFALLHRL